MLLMIDPYKQALARPVFAAPAAGGVGNFDFMPYPQTGYATVAFTGAGKDQPQNLCGSRAARPPSTTSRLP